MISQEDEYTAFIEATNNMINRSLPPLPSDSSESSSINTEYFPDDGLFYRLQKQNASLPPQDSTAFILAQIERQNVLLEKDPKSIYIQSNELKAHFSTVQRLVKDNIDDGAEEEEIDWGFWEAVIEDSDQVALRLPHLLSLKLRSGIPSRVRGLMWQAMSKSASLHLETVYEQLGREKSPHERIIQRDLARTFPRIDMFKQENGQGQSAMRRILEAYSLYDTDVGYCQGLAFLVGPLLMNMPETQSFCVFVRLMETYEMRSMFTLNMEGLQLRLHQFTRLLHEILPDLAKHLDVHGIHPAMYASQWFLTLFAYAFPISLVVRIYDIVFAEGAAETIMRVAIAMLKRSGETLLHNVNPEFEDILDFITSRKLCEPYIDNYGSVIRDAMALSDIITRDKLDLLSAEYSLKSVNKDDDQVVIAAATGKFGFWRRKRSTAGNNKSRKSDMRRSASAAGTHATIHKMQSSPSEAAAKPPMLKKRWSSVSSPRDWTYSNDASSIISESTVDSPDAATKLNAAMKELEELKEQHLKTLRQLDEVQHDKQDLECERGALKLTIAELERRRQWNEQKVDECVASPVMLSARSFSDLAVASSCGNGNVGAGCLSNSTVSSRKNSLQGSSSSATMLTDAATTDYDDDDDDEEEDIGHANTITPASTFHSSCYLGCNEKELSYQLVQVKVKNFELEQQCEKLHQDLDLAQSKFDMVNEGQMALVERLVAMKTDMEEAIHERKETELERHSMKQENNQLRFEIANLRTQQDSNKEEGQQQCQRRPRLRRHSTSGILPVANDVHNPLQEHDRVQILETTVAQTKLKLAENEFSSQQHTNKKKLSSSHSIYGRVLNVFAKSSSTL